jgi:hypothetical protein
VVTAAVVVVELAAALVVVVSVVLSPHALSPTTVETASTVMATDRMDREYT